MVDASSLATLVRVWRERVPLTQEELAQRAGVSVSTLRGLEAGRVSRPRTATVRLLADALELTDQDRGTLVAVARGDRPDATGIVSGVHTATMTSAVAPSPVQQLPRGIADFVGREGHIARVERALEGGGAGSRVVGIAVVAGCGGVGKTALAVHVAHRLADDFADGQLFVDLRGAQRDAVDPMRALGRFLRALGVDESALPDDLDERAELYRARMAGRRCLVVLDNAASEAQLRPLLPGTASCAVLVTSRRRLTGLEGAHRVDLNVFEPGQAAELLARIAGSARLSAEPDAARDVVELCGYLPLAVRITGARLAARPHWQVADLVDRLSDERRRLDELAGADLDVRASIGSTYQNLDAATRRAFRLLGLIDAPDVAVWVVAALMDATSDDATDLVDELVTAHLVEVAGSDPTGHVRYRLHDLVRLYARERAVEEDPDDQRREALARALGAWLALAEQADDLIPIRESVTVHGDAPRWRLGDHAIESLLREPMAWFDAERVALVAAVALACSLGLDEFAWDLSASTYAFFDRCGLLDDWERTHMAALVACRRAHNARGQAVMARNLAALCEQRGRDRLLLCADEAVAASRELQDRQLEAESLIEWGILHRHDDPDAARARINDGLALADIEGHALASVRAQLWLGVMHREAGDHDAAAQSAGRCLTLARQHNHPDRQIEALRLLGASRREQALYQQSEDAFTQALHIARSVGSRVDEARVLTSLGDLYVHCRRAEARATLERSLELASNLGDDFGQGMGLRILGELDLAEHRYDDALTHLLAALQVSRRVGFAYGEALALRAIGDTNAGRGDPDSARSAWDQARRLFEQLGNTDQATALAERPTKPVNQQETGCCRAIAQGA